MAVLDIRRYLVEHLGELVLTVPHARQSPLLELGGPGEDPVKSDLTDTNLFIKCSWFGLLPHLKWALSYKGMGFFFRVVTDERLKNVFVGNEGYKARHIQGKTDLGVVNGFDDLLGSHVDLAIIKVGYLGYKNAAAAGCMKEALMLRQNIDKPTWIVEDPNMPWVHSRDPDLATYIDANFEYLTLETEEDLEGKIQPQKVRPEDEALEDGEIEEIERNFNEEPDEEPDDGGQPEPEPEAILNLSLPGENNKKKGRWRK